MTLAAGLLRCPPRTSPPLGPFLFFSVPRGVEFLDSERTLALSVLPETGSFFRPLAFFVVLTILLGSPAWAQETQTHFLNFDSLVPAILPFDPFRTSGIPQFLLPKQLQGSAPPLSVGSFKVQGGT